MIICCPCSTVIFILNMKVLLFCSKMSHLHMVFFFLNYIGKKAFDLLISYETLLWIQKKNRENNSFKFNHDQNAQVFNLQAICHSFVFFFHQSDVFFTLSEIILWEAFLHDANGSRNARMCCLYPCYALFICNFIPKLLFCFVQVVCSITIIASL